MKTIIYLSLLMSTLAISTACSSTEKPGEAAKKYAQYIADGKYEKFVDGIAYDDSATTEQIAEYKKVILSLLQEKGKKSIEEKDGLKRVEIISEVLSADGNEAKVMLKQTYGNGETEDAGYDMIKKNGIWKMVVKK